MAAMASPRRPDPRQGVFETMLVLDGRPAELDAHLARLEASLEALYPDQTPPPLDVPSLERRYGRLTHGTSRGEGLEALRIVVAPGAVGRLEARTTVRKVEPPRSRVALRSLPLPSGLGGHKWADRSLLDQAQAGLPDDALPLVVDTDGTVLEASRANLFAVRDGALFTPPLDGRILPGVTRLRVLELADAVGVETRETSLSHADLLAGDEVFLTGSVRGIERVHALDGTGLAAGGEVSSELDGELRRSWTHAQVG